MDNPHLDPVESFSWDPKQGHHLDTMRERGTQKFFELMQCRYLRLVSADGHEFFLDR